MTSETLTGKTALVTGASRGIGRAIALALAERGADVVVHYLRKGQAAKEVVSAIELLGRRAISVKANLANKAQTANMFTEIATTMGHCDIFIANAASGIPKDILQVTDKHWDWTMDTNARSVLRCVQQLVPGMKESQWGRVIAITSPGSRRTLPHYAPIGLSKATLEALTRYLAVDLAPHGIIVNAVSPGLVNTDALSAFPVDITETLSLAQQKTPAGRLVTPQDVAQVVAFLCSDEAAMIVGQTLTVDGGYGVVL